MDLNTFVNQFIESLNDSNLYFLYFLEESPEQLDRDEIIEIFDQYKASGWYEALINVKS
jgi:hypothetical protein